MAGHKSIIIVSKITYLAIDETRILTQITGMLELMLFLLSHGAYYGKLFLISVEIYRSNTKKIVTLSGMQAGCLDHCVCTTLFCLLRHLPSLLHPQMIKF